MGHQGHHIRWPARPRNGLDPERARCDAESARNLYNWCLKPAESPDVDAGEFNLLLLSKGEAADAARVAMQMVLEGKHAKFQDLVRKGATQ